MKNKIILALAALAFAGVLAEPASAQVSSLNLTSATNAPLTLAASTGVVSNNVLFLTRDCDLALTSQLYVTNGTSVVTLAGSFSIDQTNFGLAPFLLTGTAPSNNLAAVTGGTNLPVVVHWTNWPHSTIAGFTAMNLSAFTNSSSTSTVFNAGIKFNRPTINTQTY